MNNEELIEKFLETHSEYKSKKDYLLVDSDGYIIICVFHSYLMIHFNAWLSKNFRDKSTLVLQHYTAREAEYTKRYYYHMKKECKNPIKCYAFKKDKCVLDVQDDKYSFDECTFWVSEETKTKILKFHSQLNHVIDDEDERLTEENFPINVLNIIDECSNLKTLSINIRVGYDFDYFKSKEKKKI